MNFRTLNNQIEKNSTKYDKITKENTEKGETARIWDNNNEGKLLCEMTTAERDLLLNDASENTDPPLRNLVKTHNPVSYLSQHPQTGTSLGKLDRSGRSLDEYIRIMMSDTTTRRLYRNIQKLLPSDEILSLPKVDGPTSTQYCGQ